MSGSEKKPALLGGKPLKGKPFPPYNTIGREEKERVMKVLETGLLSGFKGTWSDDFYGGPFVREMEREFEKHFGAGHAVSMNSATSALHAAVFAAGIGPGDEVIVPPYTMSETASAVLMQNAVPVFADIRESNYCIDPESIRENLSKNTKAIMPVHLFGMPADMKEIMGVAEEHSLKVLEDAAQAPGAAYRGKYCGTIGNAGVLSLNRHKTIQCGEGGVLLTNERGTALKAQLIRNHGEAVVREMGVGDRIKVLGYNYRLTEMGAAVGTAQLRKLKGLNRHRIKLAEHLTKRLKGFEGIIPPAKEGEKEHVYYVYPLRVVEEEAGISRNLLVEAMKAEGFPIDSGYVKPLYLEPIYQAKSAFGKTSCPFNCRHYTGKARYEKGLCPVTERMHEKELATTTICRAPLKKEDIDLFAEGVEKVLASAAELKHAKEKQ